MSYSIRTLLHQKIAQSLRNGNPSSASAISSNLRLNCDENDKQYFYSVPLKSKQYDIYEEASSIKADPSEQFLEDVKVTTRDSRNQLNFTIPRDYFIKQTLDTTSKSIVSPTFICDNPQNVIVEFSSPNIAKPFHVGHLRSTIIGNFMANTNTFLNNKVTKINYLGDWGTQFGLVQLGLTLSNVPDKMMEKDPMHTLYNAYVYANKLADEDPLVEEKAKEIFNWLEKGDEESVKKWKIFKHYTLTELRKTYSRIGIEFDEYHWESMYDIDHISGLIAELEKLKLLVEDDVKRKVIKLNESKNVPFIKSDGSTLYITRDVAAAIDRFEKFKFDAMYYVVDNAQALHFSHLKQILEAMKVPWADRLMHVKFGKIRGMSTRKGTAVFLEDLLNETKILMKEKQILSPNTKIDTNIDDPSTDILGVSAVIINDLRQRRMHDYDFDWDKALDIKKDSGVRLQYTHCRLISLEKNSGMTIASECVPSLLMEPTALDLILSIGKFEEAIVMAHRMIEPSILVKYLFNLSHSVGRAMKVLKVKGESDELAGQRLLLMRSARNVLAQGMKLLGLTPLNEM